MKSRVIPTPPVIQAEIDRLKHKEKYKRAFRSTFCLLIFCIAVVVLISALVFPVFRTHGNDMDPTLKSGQLVCAMRTTQVEPGDIICFYYNNKVLIKRVIAVGGDSVSIDWHGNVTVNNKTIDEPYLRGKSYGDCNISLPCKVPLSKLFVMGDNRSISVDSRHTEVGFVSQEQIIGKLILRIWPLDAISAIK